MPAVIAECHATTPLPHDTLAAEDLQDEEIATSFSEAHFIVCLA